MHHVDCKEARVIESTTTSNNDLRTTLNDLCDKIESGHITNMDMTIITMGVESREITVSSIRSSAQLHPTKILPNKLSTVTAQAIGVDEMQLFNAYNLLCGTIQPLIYSDNHKPNAKVAKLRMGASDYPFEMVPRNELGLEDGDEAYDV